MSLNQFICFYFLLFNSILNSNANAISCDLPERCRIGNEGDIPGYYLIYKISSIFCDINSQTFEFKFSQSITDNETCVLEKNQSLNSINFRWMSNDLTALEKKFNFSNVIRYFDYFEGWSLNVYFWYLKGFDVNFLDKNYSSNKLINININNCRLDFYHNKKKMNSCQDFAHSNITEIQSIFQIEQSTVSLNFEEYKQKICPLVFMNSRIQILEMSGLIETFYKKNLLSFSSEEINARLDSQIRVLDLKNGFNLYLDLDILNPSVFNYTEDIRIRDSFLNRINGDIFEHLKNLLRIEIDEESFRKINHKQGINWIRQWNHDVNVNLSNIHENCSSHKEIIALSSKIPKIFPEEDFCIYVDFPFNQLVILFVYFYDSEFDGEYKSEGEFTCTYLWLVKHYDYYMNSCKQDISYYDNLEILATVFNSTGFKSISKCNFERKLSYCNKSNYHIKDIWDLNDFLILSKKLQIVFKILLYPTAFLGLITNIIVVIVIQMKENSDLFKEFKHYSYLCLNSVFCIMIFVIELLSWMNECFYPFSVFCPQIRKLVAIQFFKIIFKECFVTLFRFMCNFSYVAFALNRIGLIGKDHGKIITFVSHLGIKKYIGITLMISASFSWINYFKYYVNYSYKVENDEFPFSIESIIYKQRFVVYSSKFIDAYYIINSISFVLNYFLFVILCAIIDICMVVQLRRVLEEKTKKSESMSMNQKQNETKKAENEEAVNKAIKMVVLNTAIGILFKLPISFIPLINLVAEFFQKNSINRNGYFFNLYVFLKNSEFNNVIEYVSYFLFTLSLSIQFFIYNRFDKKFRTGYERLSDKVFCRKKT